MIRTMILILALTSCGQPMFSPKRFIVKYDNVVYTCSSLQFTVCGMTLNCDNMGRMMCVNNIYIQ